LCTTAFQLAQAGWFLNPDLAEGIFANPPHIIRMLGPYYGLFMDEDSKRPQERYLLDLGDLEPGGRLARICTLLQQYEDTETHNSVEVALANFTRSYACGLSPDQQAALLFTSLDSLFGGRHTAGFRDRVRVALELTQAPEPDIEASWLDSQGR